ncbi:MAG: hypothetical protein KA603_00530 [Azonexus sp.]|nr:hypothetical protein [Betaproteobacteria bacterium]MBK8918671.1 hypothetical protein [Betaproteobacteria bacterium]MBP6034604.1 hypothetical protein [Azonexus sp.]MBP6905144.1 hypothetical protein [Azonexus sp.]
MNTQDMEAVARAQESIIENFLALSRDYLETGGVTREGVAASRQPVFPIPEDELPPRNTWPEIIALFVRSAPPAKGAERRAGSGA